MNIIKRFKLPDEPPGLFRALERQSAKQEYSSFVHIFYCIHLGAGKWCGVAGDGDNGGYDWFVWCNGELKCSDLGYGSTEVALRDVLNQEVTV